MSGALRLFWIEARRSTAIWFVPIVVAVTWYLGREEHTAAVTLWSKTSAQVGETLVVLGPLIGGLAAWIASRDRRRGVEELLATTPKSPANRDLLGYGSVIFWGLLAYGVVVAVIFGMTARSASWGRPDFLPVGLAIVTIALSAAAGYAAGLYVPSRFTPALVPVLLAIALIAPTGGSRRVVPVGADVYVRFQSPARSFTPLTFVDANDYDPFYDSWPGVALPLFAWLVAITGLAIAAILLKRKRAPFGWGVLGVSMLAGVIAGIGLYEANLQGMSWVETELVCQGDRITVCMHPAYEPILDDATALVHDLTEPVAGLPGVPTRIEQTHFWIENSPDGALKMHFYNWIYNGDTGRADDAEMLVRQMLCEAECAGYWEVGYRFGDPAREVVGTWLMEQAGVEMNSYPRMDPTVATNQEAVQAAVDRFAALDPDTRRAWLEQNFSDLRAGALDLDDLP